MASQIMKNVATNLAFYLALGLLAGTLFHNPALGVLGGLVCHLIISGFFRPGDSEKSDE